MYMLAGLGLVSCASSLAALMEQHLMLYTTAWYIIHSITIILLFPHHHHPRPPQLQQCSVYCNILTRVQSCCPSKRTSLTPTSSSWFLLGQWRQPCMHEQPSLPSSTSSCCLKSSTSCAYIWALERVKRACVSMMSPLLARAQLQIWPCNLTVHSRALT